MIDIDHFKKINDAYGHECGDKVLIGVSRNIKQTLREQDTVARWGGEEFLCRIPGGNRVRKAQYHYGWDWGPQFVTCGI